MSIKAGGARICCGIWFALLCSATALSGQMLPPAPVGSDPLHNSPLTMTEFAWFTRPGTTTSGEGDYTRATISLTELANAMVPQNPAVRYANFQPRIGTVLESDDPRTWNWDRNDRAQMQDAFYQLIEPTWELLPNCTNWVTGYDANTIAIFQRPGDPGTTDEAWRSAAYCHLNVARYLAFGEKHVRYIKEDPAVLPWVQYATYWEAGNNTITHTPTPGTPLFSDLVEQGCSWSNLDLDFQTVGITVWGYLVDETQDRWPGHRVSLLDADATRAAVGSFKVDPADMYAAWGFGAFWVRNPGGMTGPVLETDPLKTITVYPSPGYIPCTLLADSYTGNPAYDIMFSIRFDGANAFLSEKTMKELNATVTRDGIQLPIKNARWANQTYYFTVNLGWDTTQKAGTPGYYRQLDPSGFGEDQIFEVTYHGIQFTTDNLLGPSTDQDPIAYTTRDYSYRFTIFNPEKVVERYLEPKSAMMGISGRSTVGVGESVEVSGFQISGSEPLRVAIRAQGPGLARYGVSNSAAATKIDLHRINGDGTSSLVGSNSNWRESPNWRLLLATQNSPSAAKEAALVATLPPGLYTAQISDPSGKGGVGLAEVYAIDTVSGAQLTGVSNRALVGTGDNALVAGFQIARPMTIMVRTQGPSLDRFGIMNRVNATRLTVTRLSDSAIAAVNQGWKTSEYGNARFQGDLAMQAPESLQEAAVVLSLQPGRYTATVEAADGKPGVGIVEVYQEPDPS